MDLLLYFIRRDELDIYDIPIGSITKEFIKTIEMWKRLNMRIAGDFIVMASTLMRVKAKMLIPRQEIDEDGEVIDPRRELIEQLIEYKRFKNAGFMIMFSSILYFLVFGELKGLSPLVLSPNFTGHYSASLIFLL